MELKKQFHRKKTIAEVLSEKGYNTIAINKNPYIPAWKGFGKGFDTFYGHSDDLNVAYSSLLRISKKIKLNPNITDLILGIGISCDWEQYYELIVKQLRNANKPFFIWILLLDTHIPYFPKKRNWSAFSDNFLINYKMRKANWCDCFSAKEKSKLINAYDDSILYADGFVKRLKEDVEKEDPIFILHADHGDGLGEHGFYHHPPMLYEELIHVPLVIYNADIRGKIEEPVSLRGISPSILELIDEENVFPYKSFITNEKDYVISKVFDKGERKVAVRMKRWKYIEGQLEGGELFDLKKDPAEQKNLVKNHPDLVKELRNIVKYHIRNEEKIRILKRF